MTRHEGNDENGKSSEELRAELESTRERVSEDVEALGTKLSPENLKAEAKQAAVRKIEQGTQAVRETWHRGTDQLRKKVQQGGHQLRESVDEAETSIARFARENPIPLALIGAGLGLLLASSLRRSARPAEPDPALVGRGGVYEDFDDEPGSWDRSGALSHLRERAREGVERAREGVASARHAASDAAQRARHRVDDLEQHAKAGAGRAKAAAERTLHEKPLVLGAVALGAGVAVGLSIPATESENQLVGRYRDQVFGSVKQRLEKLERRAEDALSKAGESISQAGHSAQADATA